MKLSRKRAAIAFAGLSLTGALFQNCSVPLAAVYSSKQSNSTEEIALPGVPMPTGAAIEKVTEWMAAPGFHSYFYANKILEETSATGIDTYSLDTNLFGDESGFSGGEAAPSAGVWNFDPLMVNIAKILVANPKARLSIRAYAGAPSWWKALVPDELDRYADGSLAAGSGGVNYVSVGSPVMMDHWKIGVVQLRNALASKGYLSRVESVVLTGLSSQEWISWDANFLTIPGVRPMIYGTNYRARYSQWHQQRYATAIEVPSETDFQNFQNPAGGSFFADLATSANVVHYFEYRSETTAKTIVELAQEFKNQFGAIKVGAIYGYMNEMGGDPTYGHNALAVLLSSTAVDFINPMSSYQDRMVGGADFERQPVTSVNLNGKQILNDLDQGTHVSKTNYDHLCAIYAASGDARLLEIYRTGCASGDPASLYDLAMSTLGFRMTEDNKVIAPDAFETVSNFRRYVGYSIARNIKFNFLSLHNDPTAGAEKSYLSDASLLKDVIPQLVKVKTDSATKNLKSTAQILVISDEYSNGFVRQAAVAPHLADRTKDIGGMNFHSLATVRIGLNKIGAPYDHILLSDLGKVDANQYKLVIFLNAWSVDSNMRTLISQKLQNNGRLLVWNYGAGAFRDGVKSLGHVSSLTGINIVSANQIAAPSVAVNPAIFPMFTRAYQIAPAFANGCCDLFYAADASAGALGYHTGTDMASMAIRDFGSWKSLWSATVTMPGGAWRDIARFAGVHIYNEVDEPFYANSSFVTLVASGSGSRTLKFPSAVTVREAISDSVLATNVNSFTFTAAAGGVYIYRLEK